MKRTIILCLAAALAACKSAPPAVEVRTVEVPVIRVERCLAAGDMPPQPAALPKRPGTISAALDVAVAKVLEWQSYGARAAAAMKGCGG